MHLTEDRLGKLPNGVVSAFCTFLYAKRYMHIHTCCIETASIVPHLRRRGLVSSNPLRHCKRVMLGITCAVVLATELPGGSKSGKLSQPNVAETMLYSP